MEATPPLSGPLMEGMEVERDGVCGRAVSSDGRLLRAGHWSRAVEEDEESDVEKDSAWPPAHTTGVGSGQLCGSRAVGEDSLRGSRAVGEDSLRGSRAVREDSLRGSVCRAVPAEDMQEGDDKVREYFYQLLERTTGPVGCLLTASGRRPVSQHSTRESASSTPEPAHHHPLGHLGQVPGNRHSVEDILNKCPEYSSLNPALRLRLIDSQRHPEVSDHPDPQSRTDTRRYDVRLNTFHRQPHKWPLERPSAQQLARVGFTYKGMEDTVLCHSCGLELSDWAEPGTPEPLLRHYMVSSTCPFILQAFRDQLPSLRAQQDSQRSKYTNTSARLHSFSSWPFSDIVTSYQLASVGFYYTGEGAKVICFSCGITISEWKRGDVPLLVHRNRSPHCQFLTSIITKGSSSPSPSPAPPQQPMPRLRLLEAPGSSGAASRPDWSNPQTRLKSFKKLSPAFPVPREALAGAGLYLLRLPDVMKCFSCSAVVDRWTEGDTAVEKHREVSPHCEFLSRTYPSKLEQEQSPSEPTFDPSSLPAPQFDEQTLEKMAQEVQRVEPLPPPVYQPETGMASLSLHDDSTLPSSVSSHPSLSTYLSLPGSLSTHHHLPASQSTLPSSLSTHPSPSSSHPSLLPSPQYHYPHSTESQPLSLSATLSPSPHLPQHSEGPASPSPSSGSDLFSSAEIMGKSVSLPPSYHSQPSLPDTPLTYPMSEQPSSLPAGAECVVCMDRPLEMVLVPCGHVCVCEICSTQITRCPICRKRKQMSVKVYYPY